MSGTGGEAKEFLPPLDSLPYAGPWLRYHQSGVPGKGSASWTGSVLFVTRGATGGGASGNGAAAAAGASSPPPGQSPTLHLIDSFRDANIEISAGERSEAPATWLDTVGEWAFWRFELAFQLTPFQRAVQYRVEAPASGVATPTYTFWLPAEGQPMHW